VFIINVLGGFYIRICKIYVKSDIKSQKTQT